MVAVTWSGGKDGALALDGILESERYEVAAVITMVTTNYDRVSIHGVRRALLRRQAAALGFELIEVPIPPECSNGEYENASPLDHSIYSYPTLAYGALTTSIHSYFIRM